IAGLAASRPAATMSSVGAVPPPLTTSNTFLVASASTIMIATSPSSSMRPATTMSNVASSSSLCVGKATHSPLMQATRVAPTGPVNGSPDKSTAAAAELIARTSYRWFGSSARTVLTTWTSLRRPFLNDGRSGRSVRRQVRIASSPGRPSRRKNEPGILPAAYIRSSTSTVRGKKSMPSRGFDVQTVDRSVVSPTLTRTAPSARFASLPVSRLISRPAALMGPETRTTWSLIREYLSCSRLDRSSRGPGEVSVPSCQRPLVPHSCDGRALATDNRLRSRGLRMSKRAADGRDASFVVLPANAQLGDDRSVPLDVLTSQVVEHPPSPSDEHQQAALAVEVLLVDLHVLGEVANALREQRDLHFGRPCVGVVQAVVADRCGF